jgi:hypothetical protein
MLDLIRYEFSEQGLRDALVALGTTPNAVATNLLAMGYRGYRRSDHCCPLANYLRAVIVDASSASVLLDDSDKTPYTRVYQVPQVFVDTNGTTATAQFIRLFDRGRYTDLEASDAS